MARVPLGTLGSGKRLRSFLLALNSGCQSGNEDYCDKVDQDESMCDYHSCLL